MEDKMGGNTIKKTNLIFVFFAILGFCPFSFAQFVHPGIFSSQAELDFIKATVNASAAHPMKTGFSTMKSFFGANLSYSPNPLAQVAVVASGVGPDEANFRDASHAAYAHALQWVITGNSANKDKAIQIYNSWSKVFRGMTPVAAQRQLEAAWVIPVWVAGAEIIRYYNHGAAGWAEADIRQFCGMLDTLLSYTKIICTDKRTNNWGSSAALSMLAAGVFENDTAKFSLGKSFYQFLLPYQVEKTGLVMETCRDCNHAEYNMIGMLQAAEVAWKQGVDLYGIKLDSQTTPRLMMGLEFQANSFLGTPLNVGQSCGAVSCSGDDLHGPGWEIGRNHYLFRAKLPIPATDKFVLTKNRPVGTSENHFVEWTTLSHADLGAIATSVARDRRTSAGSVSARAATIFFHQQGSALPFSSKSLLNVSNCGSVEILSLQGKRLGIIPALDVANQYRISALATGTYVYRILSISSALPGASAAKLGLP
jgi:hypothetical protein